MSDKLDVLNVENAHIIFRNFSGKESKFNRAGSRNFCVIISDEKFAKQLEKDGWNIKTLKAREEDEPDVHYMQVAVRFDNIPPNIYLITSHNKTRLDEESIDTLDYADITNADVVIRPYHYDVNGKAGIKAYVKSMYITIEEDKFAAKYADGSDSPMDALAEDVPF